MAAKKVTEANHIFSNLLAVNDEVAKYCGCSYPENQVLHAYKIQDIFIEGSCFVDPIIFALEYHERGSRIFFCTSRAHFAHYFCRIRTGKLREDYTTWHEILSNLNKCHLYFDLEFYKLHNRRVEGQKIMDDFTSSLKNYLTKNSGPESRFRTNFQEDDIRFVEFDATIASKFSRHLIVQLKNFAFQSSEEVGVFVRHLADQEEFKKFYFVNKNGDRNESLIDCSVYHEGQNLRMLGSPKFGRMNTLRYLHQVEGHEFDFHENCDLCTSMLLSTLATVSTNPIFKNGENLAIISRDPLFDFNNSIVDISSDFLPLSREIPDPAYQFKVRASVVSLIEVFQLFVYNNEPILPLLQPLFQKIVAKLKIGNSFWSFGPEIWHKIVDGIFKVFALLRSTTSTVDEIRFELGQIFALIVANVSVPTFAISETVDDNDEGLLVEFAGITINDKTRKSLSCVLRFVENFVRLVEGNKRVDYADYSAKFQHISKSLPETVLNQFPRDLQADNLSEIKRLMKTLKDCEKAVRDYRNGKVAERNALLKFKAEERLNEENCFRNLIKDCCDQHKEDFLFKRLCELIVNHSESLHFSL